MTPTSFEELALATPIQRALAEQNYSTPSPIQAQSIPILLEGRDLLGIAQTGTGKTAAFSLPILHALHNNPHRTRRKSARVLVLTPTRELATQISQSFDSYGRPPSIQKNISLWWGRKKSANPSHATWCRHSRSLPRTPT